MSLARRVVHRVVSRHLWACAGIAMGGVAFAQTPPPAVTAAAPAAPRQTQSDDYTRYELLDPSTASFRIVYEVTATTPGARYFWNPIRKGSIASNESVTDLASGKPLTFVEVSGVEAKANGLGNADPDTRYIQVALPGPVPRDGEIRLLIDKTQGDREGRDDRTDQRAASPWGTRQRKRTGSPEFHRGCGASRTCGSLGAPQPSEAAPGAPACSRTTPSLTSTPPPVDGIPRR